MRNRSFTSVLLLAGVLLAGYTLASCSKDEDSDQEPLVDDSVIQATINNETVVAGFKVILQDPVANAYYPAQQFLQMQRFVENANPQGFNIIVERISLDQVSFPLTVRHSDDMSEPTLIFNYYDSRDTVYLQNIAQPESMELTLTSLANNQLQGTFEGSLYTVSQDSVTITNGSFDMKLRVY